MTSEEVKERELLDAFCRFLEKCGYLDCDWWAEEPKAIDRWYEHQAKLKAKAKGK